jgi:hypothetical protein
MNPYYKTMIAMVFFAMNIFLLIDIGFLPRQIWGLLIGLGIPLIAWSGWERWEGLYSKKEEVMVLCCEEQTGGCGETNLCSKV